MGAHVADRAGPTALTEKGRRRRTGGRQLRRSVACAACCSFSCCCCCWLLLLLFHRDGGVGVGGGSDCCCCCCCCCCRWWWRWMGTRRMRREGEWSSEGGKQSDSSRGDCELARIEQQSTTTIKQINSIMSNTNIQPSDRCFVPKFAWSKSEFASLSRDQHHSWAKESSISE